MTTEIGKELRKLRIDKGERLLDMARALQKSASFISAIEVGKKSPPLGFEDQVITFYHLAASAAKKLRQAANQSRSAFTLKPKTGAGRDTAALFARKIDGLSEKDFLEIQNILIKSKEKK